MLSNQANAPALEGDEVPAGKFLFATDVDGTLLTEDYRLLPQVKDAVTHARSHGIHIMLATARGPAALNVVLDELGEVDFAICFGGALVLERHAGSWKRALPDRITLDQRDVADVWDKASALGVAVGAYTESGACIGIGNAWFEAELAHTREPVSITPLHSIAGPVFKILAIADPTHVAALEQLRQVLPKSLEGVYSHSNYLEIMVRGVSKGEALERFCRWKNVDSTSVVVAGDGDNDVSMFLTAGHSAAVSHASAAARAAAKWTVAADAPAGVADIITHYATSLWRIPAPPNP